MYRIAALRHSLIIFFLFAVPLTLLLAGDYYYERFFEQKQWQVKHESDVEAVKNQLIDHYVHALSDLMLIAENVGLFDEKIISESIKAILAGFSYNRVSYKGAVAG